MRNGGWSRHYTDQHGAVGAHTWVGNLKNGTDSTVGYERVVTTMKFFGQQRATMFEANVQKNDWMCTNGSLYVVRNLCVYRFNSRRSTPTCFMRFLSVFNSRLIFVNACITVVWFFPPKISPIFS